jgi:opacity protein-like surface antigen
MGQFDFNEVDHQASGFVQDKWQATRKLTLNLGVRYDWQRAVKTKDAIGPRLGVAYDLLGNGKTLIRGGVGKVYQYQSLAILATLVQQAVVAPTFLYDTTQVTSPSVTGQLPVKPGDPNATACLQPVGATTAGEAVMSPTCRAFLNGLRNQVNAGGFVNNQPTVDGDRRLAYTWAFSAGVERELAPGMALSVDYAGNRGRNNTAAIDINEGPVGANGKISRLGVNVFDPTGALVPLSNTAARNTTYLQFLQQRTLEALNSDFDSLEVGLDKRFSNQWSGRASYTLARCRDVGAIVFDTDPRLDYGRCARDNRHAFAASTNVNVWKGLGAGIVFRVYSGYPINETTGSDSNGDNVTNDRPKQGLDDTPAKPILSALDARGYAIRNGLDGQRKALLDGRLQYIWRIQRYQAGLFLEVYNLTNRANFGDPTGDRSSTNFMKTIVTDNPRTAQLGFRFVF